MDYFEDRYFNLNRKLMSFIGIWHNQPYRERILRYCIIGFILLLRLLAQVCQLFTLNFDLRSTVPILQSFIPAICFALLYYTSFLYYRTLQKILNYVRQDWQQLKDDVGLTIMRKHAYETKFFTLTCGSTNEIVSYCVVALFNYIKYKFLGLEWHLLKLYYLFFVFSVMFYLYICFSISPSLLRILLSTNENMRNTDRFPIFSCFNYFLDRDTYYYPIVIYQTIILVISVTVGVACYSTYFWFIQHTCARLSIIKNQIHRPFINNDNNDIACGTPIDLSRWMIDIIQHLGRTIEFMNLVNSLAEKCYLLQMLLAFFLVVIDFLCLFQIPILLDHKENKKDVLAFVGFICASIFPIYINCHVGQRLINYSTDVYKAVCMVPIYKISLKTQKLLLTTLIISARPCAISIGQIFVSSHEFFSDLIRKSLSFSMVLHSMQK